MIAVLQRADAASVRVENEVVGEIGEGLLILLGVADGDTKEHAEVLARKILACRIFCDEGDKKNLSVKDVNGSALVISNFTLMANCRRGNRPDYVGGQIRGRAPALRVFYRAPRARAAHRANGALWCAYGCVLAGQRPRDHSAG